MFGSRGMTECAIAEFQLGNTRFLQFSGPPVVSAIVSSVHGTKLASSGINKKT